MTLIQKFECTNKFYAINEFEICPKLQKEI